MQIYPKVLSLRGRVQTRSVCLCVCSSRDVSDAESRVLFSIFVGGMYLCLVCACVTQLSILVTSMVHNKECTHRKVGKYECIYSKTVLDARLVVIGNFLSLDFLSESMFNE